MNPTRLHSRVLRVSPRLSAVVSVSLVAGCAPPGLLDAPSKEALELALTQTIMDPTVTCEELRANFRVEYLPLVETPDQAGLAYEEHWIPTPDGEFLHVWYLPTVLDRGTVVLAQGAAGAMPCYLYLAKLMIDNGWSLVMFDYHGFGASSGRVALASVPGDLELALDWALQRTGREQVTLMGVSLGTIPAVAVAVQRPEAVNAVVLDSPVVLGDQFSRLAFALQDPQEFIDRLDPELVSDRIIDRLTAPLLIFAGSRDILTPPESARRLYDLAAGPKRLVEFDGVPHARGPYREPGLYSFNLEMFLSWTWSQEVSFDAFFARIPAPNP